MNLNQITARIGELSAELLTLHNDLAHMLSGKVERQAPAGAFAWKDLRENDLVHLQQSVLAHGGRELTPGIYKVCRIEDHSYTEELPFSVYINEQENRSAWLHYFDGTRDQSNYTGTATNAYNLLRKV